MIANGLTRLLFLYILISALTACVRLDTNGYYARGHQPRPNAPIHCLGQCP